MTPIAERIKERMKACGVGVGELSDKLHVTPGMINHYTTGKRVPAIATLMALAKVLRCSTDYLLGLKGKKASVDDDGTMDGITQ